MLLLLLQRTATPNSGSEKKQQQQQAVEAAAVASTATEEERQAAAALTFCCLANYASANSSLRCFLCLGLHTCTASAYTIAHTHTYPRRHVFVSVCALSWPWLDWCSSSALHCAYRLLSSHCFHSIYPLTQLRKRVLCQLLLLARSLTQKKKKTKPATTFSLVHTLLSLALFISLRHWFPLNRNLLRVAATVVAVAAPADLALSFFWCESFASVARLY